MKTKFLIPILTVLLWGSSACKKEDNSSASASPSIITQGQWRVTLYNDSGNDETNHFTGYAFTFNSAGTVFANKSGANVSGTWSTGTDDSQQKLYLTFTSNADFIEISNDWHILSQSSTKIQLEDVSGGGGGTDLLTFEKN